MAGQKKHNFNLEDRDYTSVELCELVGRNKSRINQLAREFKLGRKDVQGRMVICKFPKKDVEWLMNWLAENGHPISEQGRRIQEEKFNGKGRFKKDQN
jgi:hypothetical protein